MRLTQANIERVIEHLNRFSKAECPVCAHDEWTVSDTLFVLPEYEYRTPWASPPRLQSSPSIGGPITNFAEQPQVFPVVPITCATCGYVFLLSGIKLGIVSR